MRFVNGIISPSYTFLIKNLGTQNVIINQPINLKKTFYTLYVNKMSSFMMHLRFVDILLSILHENPLAYPF